MRRARKEAVMKNFRWVSIFVALAICSSVLAGVTAEEAAKLDGELTPLGAIRAGNGEGTIPAWEGGITTPPASYHVGMHHPDPFASDAVQFTITAANMDEYRDKLSPGQIAMLERYPDSWRLNVYPTRRSASYPDFVYEAAKANAISAGLAAGGNGVTGAKVTSPFPIPKQGVEGIWNHVLRYKGRTVRRETRQAAPTAGGQYTLITIAEDVFFPYADPSVSTETLGNRLAYFLQTVNSPARLAGNILLVHETLNQISEPRKAWVYNPGQRRVRRAPNVAYDNPGTASDGQRTNDQLDMFNGAPDRYEWTLVGRKEMYVPYNAYKLHSDALKYDDILAPGHVNPDHLRYELHRVWVVDAKVRPGTSHIYARRVFFFDEDSWQALAVDQYDSRGEIWRVSEAYCINYYEVPMIWDTLQAHYDLQNGRYLVYGLNNEDKIDEFGLALNVDDFTPSALRYLGRR
jgi:hypothetical protein